MNLPNSWLFYVGIVLLLVAAILQYKQKSKYAIGILFFAAFFIRLFVAHLDPFLHDWDEKFHALVARNMMDYPFKPMLKTEILVPYEYTAWCCNHIWLHKQPLFLWQMALSMKIFGISEFTIRYPSVLMGALMVPMVYRISKLYTKDSFVAFGAALFMCLSYYQLDLISGHKGMEHNDVAFGFYVLASIWAYTEYINKKSLKWVLLIGLFAGCAILNKWLTGLLVFSAWGINTLLNIKHTDTKKEIIHLIIALSVCVLVFLPWQLYIFQAFPKEAAYEFSFNSRHIFEAVEGHIGHNEHYFHLFPKYFGVAIWVLVLVGLIISIAGKHLTKKINIALAVYAGSVYIFFSLIVQTKVDSYFYVVAPLCYIYMAVALSYLLKIPKVGRVVYTFSILVCGYVLLNIGTLKQDHDADDVYRQNKIHNTNVYKNLHKTLPSDIKIVMNTNATSDVEVMFYNHGINAFHFYYNTADFKVLTDKKIRVAVFKPRPNYYLYNYILNYEGLYIIEEVLK